MYSYRLVLYAIITQVIGISSAVGFQISWEGLARRTSPEFAELERETSLLIEEIKSLPDVPRADTEGTHGYASPAMLESRSPQPAYIDLVWESPQSIDMIVLCQLRNFTTSGVSMNEGVPDELRVYELCPERRVGRLLFEFNGGELSLTRQLYPYVMDDLALRVYGIRIEADGLPFHGHGMGFFWGLSEVFCFDGDQNVASLAKIWTTEMDLTHASIDSERRIFQRSTYVNDEQTYLGIPHKPTKPHGAEGWLSKRRGKPESVVWVEVDLGEMTRIDGVRLFPSKRFDNGRVNGFGFPANFKIEAFPDVEGDAGELLVDYTEVLFDNPGHNPVHFRFQEGAARRVRLTAMKLWSPRTDAFNHLAFSEFQVLNAEKVVSVGKMVRSQDNIGEINSSGKWKLGEAMLVDGLVPEGELIQAREWLQLLEQKRQKEARLQVNNERLAMIVEGTQNTTIVTVLALLGLITIIALVGVIYTRGAEKRHVLALKERLASDLHDEVGSNLAGIRMMANTIQRNPARIHSLSERIKEVTSESAESMRDIIWLLAPLPGERRDIAHRLSALAEILIADLVVSVEVDAAIAQVEWPIKVRKEFLFFYREALQNINRHSQASKAEVRLQALPDHIILKVKDNGVGIPEGQVQAPQVLRSLKLRAKNLDAELEVVSETGMGVSVLLQIPKRIF